MLWDNPLIRTLSVHVMVFAQLNVSAFEERVAKHAFTALKQVRAPPEGRAGATCSHPNLRLFDCRHAKNKGLSESTH